ncbi:citrate lyase acyl carrier protein [Mixta tenebrionis]|uniref:Citrate lyase acyl carrier protein n=1 Tax=Mixta tenebrionis TaxID=2562439 RepID=A0A506VF49_9GAMM|nr:MULTISPECIES: citrate lyase acyl carrier protein [Mixta]QHM76911.1 Citrate lyase acyl carrier protein [Mixta theicola]TPW43690.1 citrate lyase acyl carrier protein [Mixta tenebrionis]
MKIVKAAIAGTLESSDLIVKVSPCEDGLDVTINSEVYKQFGEQIGAVVCETLRAFSVTQGQIIVEDKGALDCVIRARMQAAILRGTESQHIDWGKLK